MYEAKILAGETCEGRGHLRSNGDMVDCLKLDKWVRPEFCGPGKCFSYRGRSRNSGDKRKNATPTAYGWSLLGSRCRHRGHGSSGDHVDCQKLNRMVSTNECGKGKCDCYEEVGECEKMAQEHGVDAQAVKEAVKEALAEMGVIGSLETLQVKCQRSECLHNRCFWCRKDDGKIGLDEEGVCRSFEKF